ncbi:MAG TPA: hypothetical protein VKD08_12015 [Ignavibacteriaceae bacterium]|jgi:hypothetical protein|nr:hypothetical protein [Ignavibacteriaceae bacterium]
MNNTHKFSFAFLAISTILFSACREDVVAPGNEAGNINQPVRLKSGSSYTFIINANNITTSFFDYSGVSSSHAQLLLSLEDYSQGRAGFNIYDTGNRLVYQKLLTDNVEPISASLDGITPVFLEINFTNFSGKLRIQVFSN